MSRRICIIVCRPSVGHGKNQNKEAKTQSYSWTEKAQVGKVEGGKQSGRTEKKSWQEF